MEPLSPGIPLDDAVRNVYAYPTAPGGVVAGDDYTNASPGGSSLITAGYVVSVTRQPSTSGVSVTVNPDGSGYRVETPALPQLANGNIADSFAWKATKPGSPDVGPYRVDLEICGQG
jgi:hypothetical protein